MMKMFIRLAFMGIMLLTTMLVSPKIEAAPAQQTNLLQNPGFEMPYNSDGAASNWVRWHRNSSEDKFSDCTNGYHKLPKWSAETVSSGLIHSGSVSQHVGNQWDTWAAGVWQNVNVTPGSTYRFTVHAYGRGTNDDYPAPSEGGLQMNVRVGIDPNGSGLWNDGDVVWSGTINPHSTWQPVSIEATATGGTITVFTAADWGVQGVNQCRKHLDVWFDTAELIEVGPPPTNTPVPQPTSPPPPPATNTPVPPAATDTPDVPPTETPVPPTEEPTAVPGATVCLNAFADVNGNGVKDANEGYMGNVAFTIGRNNQVVGQAVSSGTSTPFCFDGLEPGVYEVAQVVPGALEMTTAGNASVEVAEGQTVGVEFGSRVRLDEPAPAATEVASVDQPTAVPEADQPATGSPRLGLAAISGLVVMILAVVLLGALIFVVLRRTGA